MTLSIKPEIRAGLLNDYCQAPLTDVSRLLIALLVSGPPRRRRKKLFAVSEKIARAAAHPQQAAVGVLLLEGMAASAEAAGKHQAARAARARRSQIDVGVLSIVGHEDAAEVRDSIYCLLGYALVDLVVSGEDDVARACVKLLGDYSEIVAAIDKVRDRGAAPGTWLELLVAQTQGDDVN